MAHSVINTKREMPPFVLQGGTKAGVSIFGFRIFDLLKGAKHAKTGKGSGTGEEKETEQGKEEASGQRTFESACWRRKGK